MERSSCGLRRTFDIRSRVWVVGSIEVGACGCRPVCLLRQPLRMPQLRRLAAAESRHDYEGDLDGLAEAKSIVRPHLSGLDRATDINAMPPPKAPVCMDRSSNSTR
jgi:hypothetical protein